MGWQAGEKAQNCDSKPKVSYIQLFCVCCSSDSTCTTLFVCVQDCRFISCLKFSHSVSTQQQFSSRMDVSTDTQAHAYTLILSAGTLHHHILLFSALHLAGKTGGSHAQMYYITTLHWGTTKELLPNNTNNKTVWGLRIVHYFFIYFTKNRSSAQVTRTWSTCVAKLLYLLPSALVPIKEKRITKWDQSSCWTG